MNSNSLILDGHTLDLLALLALQQQPPVPFTPGEPLFWDDPHISAQMLAAHLDNRIDVASRRPETIDRSVEWIAATLGLQPGAGVLDLGCGPGLYASRLAGKGLRVTGVDYSRRSITYASDFALQHGLDIIYRYQNYLELTDENRYDAALLIYGDFCPLNPAQRVVLLKNVRRALKPGGRFVLDVSTRECRSKRLARPRKRFLETRSAPAARKRFRLPRTVDLARSGGGHRGRWQDIRLSHVVPGLHPRVDHG